MTRGIRASLLALALVLAACPNEVDRAAKKRMFSPEEPARAKRAASEPIDLDRLAEDPELTYHVLTMGAAEAFERIGPFHFTAAASFEWSLGKEKVSLSEKRAVEQGSVDQYSVHTENNKDSGLDLVHLGDRTFARSKYHKFRERKRDRGQSDLVREDAFGALRSAESLLSNKLAVTRDRQEEIGGRKAKRFNFMVSKEALRALGPDPWKLPALKYPTNGPDQPTKRREDFKNLRAPRSVEGSVWVDTETGVPLKSELTATVGAPGEGTDDQATLVLKVSTELKPAEKVAIVVPDDSLPDQDRPNGIAAALTRFEMQKLDGGTPAPAKPESDEPEE